MNESCHTYEWVMSHIWMSHVTHMNESCHTYEWVMSHIWMMHVTYIEKSGHKRVMSQIFLCRDSFICDTTHPSVTRLAGDMAHTYVTWLIRVWHNSFIRDMTHPCVTWLIHMYNMTHSYLTRSYTTVGAVNFKHIIHKSILINKSSVNPKSTSNQSSQPCTVLQYPSRKVNFRSKLTCEPRVWSDVLQSVAVCYSTHEWMPAEILELTCENFIASWARRNSCVL